jgi:hypothetical protein
MPNPPTTADGHPLVTGMLVYYRATYAGRDQPITVTRPAIVQWVGATYVLTADGGALAVESCWASREAMEGAGDQR